MKDNAGVMSEKVYCYVVGIAGDAHLTSMLQPPEAAIYRLADEADGNVIVRGATDQLSLSAVAGAFGVAGAHVVLDRTETLGQRMQESLRLQGLVSSVAGVAALVTCFVMAVSLYGMVLLQVLASRREIGVRVALGSTKVGLAKAVLYKMSVSLAVALAVEAAVSLAAISEVTDRYSVGRDTLSSGVLIGAGALAAIVLLAIIHPLGIALAVPPAECLRSE